MAVEVQTFPYRWTQGNTGPPLTGLVGTTASPVDITGFTFKLRLRRPPGSSPLVLEKTGSIVSAPGGTFTFGTWASTDLLAGEKQFAEVEVVDGGGELVSYTNFHINVNKKA